MERLPAALRTKVRLTSRTMIRESSSPLPRIIRVAECLGKELSTDKPYDLIPSSEIEAFPLLGACPSNTKTAIFWGSKTPPGSPIVDPEALYEVVF